MKKINEFYNEDKNFFKALILLCIVILISLLFYGFLPNEIPMQFAHDGSINYYEPKENALILIPLVFAFIVFYYKLKKSITFYILIMFCVVVLLYLCTLIYISLNF
ncbi:MAG: DUF1648 domain-containing protein [Bacilli bacterium]